MVIGLFWSSSPRHCWPACYNLSQKESLVPAHECYPCRGTYSTTCAQCSSTHAHVLLLPNRLPCIARSFNNSYLNLITGFSAHACILLMPNNAKLLVMHSQELQPGKGGFEVPGYAWQALGSLKPHRTYAFYPVCIALSLSDVSMLNAL
jgi:hypothetical protein